MVMQISDEIGYVCELVAYLIIGCKSESLSLILWSHDERVTQIILQNILKCEIILMDKYNICIWNKAIALKVFQVKGTNYYTSHVYIKGNHGIVVFVVVSIVA